MSEFAEESASREALREELPRLSFEEATEGVDPEVLRRYGEAHLKELLVWANRPPEFIMETLHHFAMADDVGWLHDLSQDFPAFERQLIGRMRQGIRDSLDYTKLVSAETYADMISPDRGTVFEDEWRVAGRGTEEMPGVVYGAVDELCRLSPGYLERLAAKSSDAARGVQIAMRAIEDSPYPNINEDIRTQASAYAGQIESAIGAINKG